MTAAAQPDLFGNTPPPSTPAWERLCRADRLTEPSGANPARQWQPGRPASGWWLDVYPAWRCPGCGGLMRTDDPATVPACPCATRRRIPMEPVTVSIARRTTALSTTTGSEASA